MWAVGRRNKPELFSSLCVSAVVLVFACQPRSAVSAKRELSPELCAAQQRELVAFVQKLPEQAVIGELRVELPESTLGAVPGNGPLLELSETALYLDGAAVTERGDAERGRRIGAWLEARPPATSARPALYVAAAPSVDVKTLRAHLAAVPPNLDVRLLVRTRALPKSERAGDESAGDGGLAARLLAEREPAARAAIAAEGYAAFSTCAELERAVSPHAGLGAAARWPAIRASLLDALPRCACGELDAPALQQLAAAEQRAGAASLGWLPLSFVRDERCGASMPLRGLGKLVQQMESFDAEFSGGWQQDALKFEAVLADDRLLGFFCNALPGETLAARQRARGVLYWRAPGGDACQAWRFEPLAPGAPMGTWRRAGEAPLAFHYRQGAEEIRLFGPVPAGSTSKPTDDQPWACRQDTRLLAVDADSIQTDAGPWFFSESACRRATPAQPSTNGCATSLVFGAGTEAAPAP